MGLPAVPDTRAAELRAMKRNATGLLALVTAAFVALVTVGGDAAWVAYAIAAAEGSMVGGLADWFAVTALFRHPLGLPIPHTAIIRERKDQFGATLGEFVQENFLSPDIIGERVRNADVGRRIATWLADPQNADVVGKNVLEGAVGALDVVSDADVHRFFHGELDRAVAAVPVAKVAGRVLELAITEDRHHPVMEVAIKGVLTLLQENRERLRDALAQAMPWWVPNSLEEKAFDRVMNGLTLFLASVAADQDHEFRKTIDTKLSDLARQLQDDPAMAARGEELKRELLEHKALREWTAALWLDLKEVLRDQAADPASPLRTRTASALTNLGGRIAEDPVLMGKISDAAESVARYAVEHYRGEIGEIITVTVSHWDAEETSDKLELLLGRDLQFIRINGTVVGGMAGLTLHTLAQALG